MNKNEQDETKTVITKRFITALDYLVDSGRVKTMAEIEKTTGLRAQRITGMKAYLDGKDTNGQYAGIQHIKLIKDKYGISLEYIFDGTLPIVRDSTSPESFSDGPRETYQNSNQVHLMRRELDIVKEHVQLLSEKVEFYKGLVTQKLS